MTDERRLRLVTPDDIADAPADVPIEVSVPGEHDLDLAAAYAELARIREESRYFRPVFRGDALTQRRIFSVYDPSIERRESMVTDGADNSPQPALDNQNTPSQMEIVWALRRHTSRAFVTRDDILSVATDLLGSTDREAVNAIFGAYLTFQRTTGDAFARLGVPTQSLPADGVMWRAVFVSSPGVYRGRYPYTVRPRFRRAVEAIVRDAATDFVVTHKWDGEIQTASLLDGRYEHGYGMNKPVEAFNSMRMSGHQAIRYILYRMYIAQPRLFRGEQDIPVFEDLHARVLSERLCAGGMES